MCPFVNAGITNGGGAGRCRWAFNGFVSVTGVKVKVMFRWDRSLCEWVVQIGRSQSSTNCRASLYYFVQRQERVTPLIKQRAPRHDVVTLLAHLDTEQTSSC